MAEARRIPRPEPVPRYDTRDVQLTLNYKEAMTLAQILSRVGGDPDKTGRKYAGPILKALGDIGVQWAGHLIMGGSRIDFLADEFSSDE